MILDKYIKYRHSVINKKNKELLKNDDFSIITSNCLGGFVYHWLNHEFTSPFINLFFSNEDFILAMEHFDEFVNGDIVEDVNSNKPYPVGIGCYGIRIHFMHYKSFQEAIEKWRIRTKRINRDNMFIMLSNWNGNDEIVKRFDSLKFKNKVIFVNKAYPQFKSAFQIRGWSLKRRGRPNNLWRTKNYLNGTRYIDMFDYIGFFNGKAD